MPYQRPKRNVKAPKRLEDSDFYLSGSDSQGTASRKTLRHRSSNGSSNSQTPTQGTNVPYGTGIPPRYPLCAFPTLPLDAPREVKERVRRELEEEEARRYTGGLWKSRVEVEEFERSIRTMSIEPSLEEIEDILDDPDPIALIEVSPLKTLDPWQQFAMNDTHEAEQNTKEKDKRREREAQSLKGQRKSRDHELKTTDEVQELPRDSDGQISFTEFSSSPCRNWYHLSQKTSMPERKDIEHEMRLPSGTILYSDEDQMIRDAHSFEEVVRTIQSPKSRSPESQLMEPTTRFDPTQMGSDGISSSQGSGHRKSLGSEHAVGYAAGGVVMRNLLGRGKTPLPNQDGRAPVSSQNAKAGDTKVSTNEHPQLSNRRQRGRPQGQPILSKAGGSRKRDIEDSVGAEEEVIHLVLREVKKKPLAELTKESKGSNVATKRRKTSHGRKLGKKAAV